MSKPGKLLQPVGLTARQIPRRRFNEVISRVQGLGGNFEAEGFSAGDIRAAKLPRVRGREVRFELRTALAPGGNASAWLLHWSPSSSDFTIFGASMLWFTVHDAYGMFYGRKRGAYGSPHNLGSRGRAQWCQDARRWEITYLQPAALMLTGTTTATVSSTGPFTVSSPTVMQPIGGLICDQDPGANMTVHAVHEHWADVQSGARIEAAWNEDTGQWEWIQSDCPVAAEESSSASA